MNQIPARLLLEQISQYYSGSNPSEAEGILIQKSNSVLYDKGTVIDIYNVLDEWNNYLDSDLSEEEKGFKGQIQKLEKGGKVGFWDRLFGGNKKKRYRFRVSFTDHLGYDRREVYETKESAMAEYELRKKHDKWAFVDEWTGDGEPEMYGDHWNTLVYDKGTAQFEKGGSMASGVGVGDMVKVELNNGKTVIGKLEKENPVKVRTDEKSTQVIPNSLIKSIEKIKDSAMASGGDEWKVEIWYGHREGENNEAELFDSKATYNVKAIDEEQAEEKALSLFYKDYNPDFYQEESKSIHVEKIKSSGGSAMAKGGKAGSAKANKEKEVQQALQALENFGARISEVGKGKKKWHIEDNGIWGLLEEEPEGMYESDDGLIALAHQYASDELKEIQQEEGELGRGGVAKKSSSGEINWLITG